MVQKEKMFMSIAVHEALQGVARGDGGPFGAVIVRDGNIISQGHNMVISAQDPTAHAEMTVIREAAKKLGRFDLSDCEIYSTCEPCPMCLAAIYWAKLPRLFYGCTAADAEAVGFDDSRIAGWIRGGVKSKNLDARNVERDTCLETMKAWESKDNRQEY